MGGFDGLLSSPTSQTTHKYVALFLSKSKLQQVVVDTLPAVKTSLDAIGVHITNIEQQASFDDLYAVKFVLEIDPSKENKIKENLIAVLKEKQIDIVLYDEKEYSSRHIKLAAFDMDSCILGHECIDELAVEMGVSERVKDITARAMAGELDFNEALRERVGLLQGMKETQLETVWLRLHLNPGAVSLVKVLKSFGVKVALVSGGFTYFAYRVAARLGIDFAFSNTLEVDDKGLLTGRVLGTIVNGNMKESIVRALAEREGVQMTDVITMGDGANDQYMVRAAGIGIAYHAKSILKAATPHHIDHTPLNSLVHFANIPVPSSLSGGNNEEKVLLENLPVAAGFPSFTSITELMKESS